MASSGKRSRTGAQCGWGRGGGTWAWRRVPDLGTQLAHHHRWHHIEPFRDGLGADRERGLPQQPFARQHALHLGHGGDPPPHQTDNDRHQHGQRQEPLPHANHPLRLPGIVALQLARGQQRRTEHVEEPLFDVFDRRHRNLRPMPKIRGWDRCLDCFCAIWEPPLLRLPS